MNCLWCKRPTTGAAEPDEHIIPDSLGCPEELVFRHGQVCGRCNNRNSRLDQALIADFDMFRLLFGVANKKGRPPTIATRANAKGRYVDGAPQLIINMDPTPVTDPLGNLAAFRNRPDDLHMSFIPHGMAEGEWRITQYGPCNSNASVRALHKVALSLLAKLHGMEQVMSERYDDVRRFVLNGIGERTALLVTAANSMEYRNEAYRMNDTLVPVEAIWFLSLVQNYFQRHTPECAAVSAKTAMFDAALAALNDPFAALAKGVKKIPDLDEAKNKAFENALAELGDACNAYDADAKSVLADLAAAAKQDPPATNKAQHDARKKFDPVAERVKGLIKQVDLLYKLAARTGSAAADLAGEADAVAQVYERRVNGRLLKQLDEARRGAVEQLKHATYFHRHIAWLQDRFPEAAITDVPGLVKVVSRNDIKEADWSLTPGRYVGVAPSVVDEDFDFEQAIADIHEELAALNDEAVELAGTIQKNLEELGV